MSLPHCLTVKTNSMKNLIVLLQGLVMSSVVLLQEKLRKMNSNLGQ